MGAPPAWSDSPYQDRGSGGLLFGTLLLLIVTFAGAFIAWAWKAE